MQHLIEAYHDKELMHTLFCPQFLCNTARDIVRDPVWYKKHGVVWPKRELDIGPLQNK